MVTLKDVAQRAGVSTATVSHVLNGTKKVRDVVAGRVRRAAEELGYYTNSSARTLRTGRSYTLGLMLPDLQNPFFPSLVQVIERKARAEGYSLLLIDAANDPASEADGFRLLAGKGVDGLIWIPLAGPPPTELPYPVLVVDRPAGELDVVTADHHQGGRLLAEHALRLGHSRVGLISGPQSLASARLRRDGFLSGARGSLELAWEVETPFDLNLPAEVESLLLDSPVSLLVAGSDVIAIGALHLLQRHGIEVPADVSVLGFDDIPWASLVRPQITTVRQPIGTIGERAVEVLLRRIEDPGTKRAEEVVPVELVPRESSARMAAGVRS